MCVGLGWLINAHAEPSPAVSIIRELEVREDLRMGSIGR